MMLLLEFFISSLFSFLGFKLLLNKFGSLIRDIPNERSSHNEPKPTSGGIVFSSVYSIFSLLHLNFINLVCFPLSIFGLIDDIWHIKPFWRYLAQFFTCSLIVLIKMKFSLALPVFLVLVIIGTAFINFTNFMDGIDGLVGGCILIIFSTLNILQYQNSSIALISSLIMFLIFNWHPSKLFMGDSGSTFLGAILFGSLLQINSFYNLIGILLVSSPLFGDACLCVIRRLIAGKNIFSAHRSHLYQRLQRSGFKHSNVSLLYIFLTFILSIIFLIHGLKLTILAFLMQFIILFYIDKKYAIEFKIS